MRGRSTLVGAAFATITAVTWGGQFVVGKSALDRVNAFPLSTVRYAGAAGLWLCFGAGRHAPDDSHVRLPRARARRRSTTPQIAYLALPGAFLAVLTWNAAIGLVGPQNAVLFGNLIPVTTFAIEIVRGYRPNGIELGGAALTIAALVANNLVARGQAAGTVERIEYEYAEAA